ncbi:MAG TPA: hypothetical protein ENN80_11335, partial [Candidatus Hydrogenedentes bacterium]|nr:hypothetical protein [Candidatus Hydrogenedentota bacterium]
PNIVYILADDMGYGDPQCQSTASKIPTPHMDRLAEQGIRFTDAHSGSAVCSPTRYGLLTGRYCWRTSLKRGVLVPWDAPLIEPERLTVAQFLKQQGYDTACIGKWHLGWEWPTTDGEPPKPGSHGDTVDFTKPIENGPTTRGFDYYFGTCVPNYPPYCFIENDRTVGIPSVPKPDAMFGHPGPMLPGWTLESILPALTERAVAYIHERAQSDQPFFLYFSLTAPHTPIVPVKPFLGASEAGRYGDWVHQVDWTIGQVMAALDAAGLVDDTLLICTSDNGSPARNGENASGPVGSVLKETGHNPSDGLRGMKADIWDGGHRVPFIARWPGRIASGATSNALICHTDFFATCAALLGVTLPNNAAEDSYNILPALLCKPAGTPVRDAVVHHSGNGSFAIRQGTWKLIMSLGSGGWTAPKDPEVPPGGPRGQLYDMERDLAEEHNLWLERPDVVARLTALLEEYKAQGRSAPLRR